MIDTKICGIIFVALISYGMRYITAVKYILVNILIELCIDLFCYDMVLLVKHKHSLPYIYLQHRMPENVTYTNIEGKYRAQLQQAIFA